MNFDILNTHFAIKGTILLAPTGLTFNNIHISDMEGHSGRMNGYLHFQHFKNLNYRFEIQANNMLVMKYKRIDGHAFSMARCMVPEMHCLPEMPYRD